MRGERERVRERVEKDEQEENEAVEIAAQVRNPLTARRRCCSPPLDVRAWDVGCALFGRGHLAVGVATEY